MRLGFCTQRSRRSFGITIRFVVPCDGFALLWQLTYGVFAIGRLGSFASGDHRFRGPRRQDHGKLLRMCQNLRILVAPVV